jgi:uncharacterized membrane protein YphA (DoxX/SURF4 family)
MRPAAAAVLVLRLALGAVFIVSGFNKLAGLPENFAAAIEKYQIVPETVIPALSQAFPWLEFLAGVLFALGLWTRASLMALWAMNTAFIFILVSAVVRKLPIEQCGCFGEAIQLSPAQMIALDTALWALFLVFFISHRRVNAPSLDKLCDGRP